MNILILIVIILGIILLLELFKHQLTKNMFKFFIAAIVIMIFLLILSAYFDLGTIVGKDSTFAKTGAVITEGLVDGAESVEDSGIVDKSNELLNNIIDN